MGGPDRGPGGASPPSLLLLGCGKMGSALLKGWLASGLTARVIEPHPSPWLLSLGLPVNEGPGTPDVTVVAVKPQMMDSALPSLRGMVLSIAAGTPLSAFGDGPVVRAMPNTPAAIGRGITAIVGNGAATEAHMALAESLLSAVGEVVRVPTEDAIDAVTGLSGSGPAYVFHLIECLAAAGEAEGLAPDLALRLARATVAGAGALAMTGEDPGQLRRDVTSPNGTTQAGLAVLMAELPDLVARTVRAATARATELRG